MKKILFAMAIITVTLTGAAQGFDWHRMNISADYSYQPSLLQHGSGLLRQHPERTVSVGASYRLWQLCEVGLYANLVGADAMSSGSENIGGGQHVSYMYVTNRYTLGWGAIVQLHTIPFRMRHNTLDMAIRLGIDIAKAEADRFWVGAKFTYFITRHTALTMSADFGSFYYSRTYSNVIGQKHSDLGNYRSSFGIQVEL